MPSSVSDEDVPPAFESAHDDTPRCGICTCHRVRVARSRDPVSTTNGPAVVPPAFRLDHRPTYSTPDPNKVAMNSCGMLPERGGEGGCEVEGTEENQSAGAAMPVDLILVRHGNSEGNRALDAAKTGDMSLMTDEFRRRNASDYRLTELGEQQARAAGGWIRDWQTREGVEAFNRFYCSPFVRTRETAGLLDHDGARWQLESLLRERDFGLWAGRDRTTPQSAFRCLASRR